jgi:methylmalonyl-CoA mutase cobalamin-binding subunit
MMLSQLLEFSGYCSYTASHSALASEMVEMVAQRKADLVVVSALPPAAVTYARYLCKRVHAANPEILMTVGLWTFTGDMKKAKDRITCVANVPLVMSLTEMLQQIHQMVQPVVVRQQGNDVIAK